MASALFLAIDGGASTTRLALYDAAGGRLGLTMTGPTSLTLKGAAAWQTIMAGLETLCTASGTDVAAVLPRLRVGVGLAGANAATLRAAFLAAAPDVAAVHMATDSYIAALGAHGGGPGAIVIVGTGSAGYRIFADRGDRLAGDRLAGGRLVGGWGFPVDDAGSGGWLGWRAIGEALQVVDGRWREPPGGTGLHQAVLDHCGRDRAALLDWLHRAPSTRYGELAPIVLRLADAGDPAAQRLAGAAGAAIERIARALDPAGQTPLALVGGLAEPLAPYLPASLAAWARPPQAEALAGALMLARGEAPAELLAG